jgi:SM-20-related protein
VTLPIRIIDGAIPVELGRDLATLLSRNIWRYGWKSLPSQTAYSFWHAHFAGGDADAIHGCESELEDRRLFAPILALWKHVRGDFTEPRTLVRAYANAQTFGMDGHIHTDNTSAENYITTLYFGHEEWSSDWGGETLFFNSQGAEIIQAVSPLPGRLVHFDGAIPHCGRAPSRECPALRTVVVLKSVATSGSPASQ